MIGTVGPPCPHGSTAVCPYCDHRGFLLSYARTKNAIERLGRTDEEMEAMVERGAGDMTTALGTPAMRKTADAIVKRVVGRALIPKEDARHLRLEIIAQLVADDWMPRSVCNAALDIARGLGR